LKVSKDEVEEKVQKLGDCEREAEKLRAEAHQRNESMSKVRMKLSSTLGIMLKARTELDALIGLAGSAIPIIECHKEVCKIVGIEERGPPQCEKLIETIGRMKEENERLRRLDQVTAAITDVARIANRNGEVIGNDDGVMEMELKELDELKERLVALNRELDSLRQQIAS
jgi:phage host-nuclease inhibitor protein Gam